MKFEVDKDFINANVSRTIRFTENIFYDLMEVSEKENILFNLLVLQYCRYAWDNLKEPDIREKKQY